MAVSRELNFEAVGFSPEALDLRVRLADGAETNAYVGLYRLDETDVRVVRFQRPLPLLGWCRDEGISEAIVGGFFTRPRGEPLGELWIEGERSPSVPFLELWDTLRSCLYVDAGEVAIARRLTLPQPPAGDLLLAGPLLVRRRRACARTAVERAGLTT